MCIPFYFTASFKYIVDACPANGQIFKDCGGSCERTCNDVLSQDPFTCDVHYCVPGCGCPAGQVKLIYYKL